MIMMRPMRQAPQEQYNPQQLPPQPAPPMQNMRRRPLMVEGYKPNNMRPYMRRDTRRGYMP